jgi:hypothetical protein
MKKKNLIFIVIMTIFLLSVTEGFSQDTSKLSAGRHLKNNSDSPATVDLNTRVAKSKRVHRTHSAVNSNRGTVIPTTTSGTLGSSVNPNTQLVIPLHKNKRKSNSGIAPDSGVIIPKK